MELAHTQAQDYKNEGERLSIHLTARRRPQNRRFVHLADEFVQPQQRWNARFPRIAAENHGNGRVNLLCVDVNLAILSGSRGKHQPIGACESINVFVDPKVDCRSSTEFLDECNSEFYAFRQRVVDFYLQIPAGEESDVLKEFKNLIRSQDLEIKQLKIQLSAGGNVESSEKSKA